VPARPVLAGLFVKRVLLVPLAVLLELDAFRIILLVLFRRIVPTLALGASKRN